MGYIGGASYPEEECVVRGFIAVGLVVGLPFPEAEGGGGKRAIKLEEGPQYK